jgi:hypothetical protein
VGVTAHWFVSQLDAENALLAQSIATYKLGPKERVAYSKKDSAAICRHLVLLIQFEKLGRNEVEQN